MTLKLELTAEEVNIVMAGLGKLPAEASFNLILKLQLEFNKQREVSEANTETDAE